MHTIALIDCNNFFVSCEKVFDPKLKDQPIVVLSNNDGCAISRSNEAKKLGIKMGEPFFKFRDLAKKEKIKVLSSNFGLYSEMSRRVMHTISLFSPEVEYYSVDEAFIIIPNNIKDTFTYGLEIRKKILQWTGIPVSIGIAKTKTLTKIANELVKASSSSLGVLDLSRYSPDRLDNLLKSIPVQDIWGIGRQQSSVLQAYQVHTAFEFKNLDPGFVKKKFTITGLRTHQELNDIYCLEVKTSQKPQQSMVVSRSFGRPTNSKTELLQSLTSYVAKAAEKLRSKELKLKILTIYITDKKTFHKTQSIQFPEPTHFTSDLIKSIPKALDNIYNPNITYKKAGIICHSLVSAKQRQLNLLEVDLDDQKKSLTSTLDNLNRKYGHNTVQYLVMGLKKKWTMKQERKSPNYLSDWSQIVKVF